MWLPNPFLEYMTIAEMQSLQSNLRAELNCLNYMLKEFKHNKNTFWERSNPDDKLTEKDFEMFNYWSDEVKKLKKEIKNKAKLSRMLKDAIRL